MKPPFISQTGTACDGQCSSSLPHFHAQLPPSLSNYPRVPDFRVELVPNDEQSSPSKTRAYSPSITRRKSRRDGLNQTILLQRSRLTPPTPEGIQPSLTSGVSRIRWTRRAVRSAEGET